MNRKLVFSVGFAFAAATSLAGLRATTPAAWNGDPNCWQMGRHNEKMAAVTNGGSKVVFIGDSITHFWETTGNVQWKRYFAGAPYKALDLGTSADRTEHVLWRLTKGGELDGYEAKVILLMIGTNNTGHNPFAKETPIDTIEGIRKILAVISEKQPTARIILQSIFPRGATANDPLRLRNDAVNRVIQKFADGKKVIWCDFSDKFLDGQGRLSPEIFPDLLHPNARGYEMWASAVLPLVDRCLTAPSDEVIPSVWPSNPTGYYHGPRSEMGEDAYPSISWWQKGLLAQHRTWVVDNPSGEFDLVMLGDSITHRWYREPNGEGRELYVSVTNCYNVLNLGIGGDQARHLLWRLENGELEGYKAKCFTLMIGTNDGATRDWQCPGVAKTIARIVSLVREKHPESTLILMPIFPRNAKPDDPRRVCNAKISELIKPLADGKTVIWLDFNAKFLTADGILTKDVMADLLHPNANGYRIWLDAIAPLWKEIIGK